jgi:hypothetical protein
MSVIHNEQQLENIYDEVVEMDNKGLLEIEITDMVINYGLHPDDDRDEILQLIFGKRAKKKTTKEKKDKK